MKIQLLYKTLLLNLMLLMMPVVAQAQNAKGFNPEQFEKSLETYVIQHSKLTQKETAAFLPLFRSMRKEQVACMKQDRKNMNVDCDDEKACAEAIRNHDAQELQMKKIQQHYHNQLLKKLPAIKVMLVIRAESDFHREAFGNMHMKKRDHQRQDWHKKPVQK